MRISPRTFEGIMLSSLLVAAMLATLLIAAFPTIPSWGFVVAYALLTAGVLGMLMNRDTQVALDAELR